MQQALPVALAREMQDRCLKKKKKKKSIFFFPRKAETPAFSIDFSIENTSARQPIV